jgi:uncharacterized protein YabE (DUF348 family)
LDHVSKVRFTRHATTKFQILKSYGFEVSEQQVIVVLNLVVHFSEDGKPLFMEILRASKIVPLMVEGLAKKEVTVT